MNTVFSYLLIASVFWIAVMIFMLGFKFIDIIHELKELNRHLRDTNNILWTKK